MLKTYLCSKLITDEEAIFDLYGTDHIIRHPHHHLLLLKLLSVEHSLLLALQLLLITQLLLRLFTFLLLAQQQRYNVGDNKEQRHGSALFASKAI